jgi:type IV pilus assembly protein PilX
MKMQTFDIRHTRQRGIVLFISLIALVVMSLAAVALLRSVDTNTIIAGNLAFRQAATTSSDAGVEAALTRLDTISTGSPNLDPMVDISHPFNTTTASTGYYSNADPAINLSADATWTSGSALVVTDSSGNTVRYLIQRMCRTADQLLSEANCLLSDADTKTSSQRVRGASDAGGRAPSSPPLYRITVRTTGPKNTTSYIQAFVY